MLEIPFHQEKNLSELKTHPDADECSRLSSEGLHNFEEFQQLLRASYLSIKAPFESLSQENMELLTKLNQFLHDVPKMESMNFLINYGERSKWQ